VNRSLDQARNRGWRCRAGGHADLGRKIVAHGEAICGMEYCSMNFLIPKKRQAMIGPWARIDEARAHSSAAIAHEDVLREFGL